MKNKDYRIKNQYFQAMENFKAGIKKALC